MLIHFVVNGYLPATDVPVNLRFMEDVGDGKMIMPGDNVELKGELYYPMAIEAGQRFNLREGGR